MEEPKKPAETKEENKHLAIVTNGRGLALRNIDDMWRFACMVRDSGLAPQSFKKPEQIIIAIQAGAEHGIPPMKSLNCITVINGAARLWGDMPLALVRQSKLMEYIEESIEGEGDQRAAVCKSKRLDSPNAVITRFDVEDARLAGLWGKAGPWKQYPERMLKYRARAFNLRDNFPDALAGIGIAEEFEGLPEPDYEATTPKREDRKPVDVYDVNAGLLSLCEVFIEKSGLEPLDAIPYFADWVAFELGGAKEDYLVDGIINVEKFDKDMIDSLMLTIVEGIAEPVAAKFPKADIDESAKQLEDDFDKKMKPKGWTCKKCGAVFDEPKGMQRELCPECLSDSIEAKSEEG